ncbi:class I SAM-dependent methyltransferase [Roseibium sp. Sym1]|uniref:class I SAM-dependent methyltransferase n=1 Tax=Roseibium sp. Sym1 TaxID=3016006 RepID=UPI0022B437EB|nr:class I SAM-dependent methyltransferase [Roseibium sp. Sym1]
MSRLTSKLRSFAHKKSKQFSRKNLYEFIHDAAKSAKDRGGRCLNIGAGGEINTILQQYGLDIVSVDIDPDRNPDLVMDACNLAFEDGTFDTVFLFEVLEHVPEPHRAVAEINRVLKRDGKIFCSTPFVFGIHDAPHDYFRYTKYGLAYLFRSFDNLKITERNSYYETVCVLMLRLTIVPDKPSRNFGLATAVAVTVLAPVVSFISKVIKNRSITTGYTLEATKSG